MCSPIALVVEEEEEDEDEEEEKAVCLNSEGLSVNGVMVLMILLELDFGLSNPEFSWNRDNGAEEECLSTLKNK